ncbi:MAG: YvcK family protein [Candidatus Andersenbacteria bacterium]|nr:YvcK family protein [Candidatus Andersenbacteria bacterium]
MENAVVGKPRVVVLGGGNGTSRLLKALLPWQQAGKIESLYALVHMADDGGSTGKLRAQYEVGAMGDLTNSLIALSTLAGDIRGEELLKALAYRFESGDFKGHTLRNILLTVFELTSHDIDSAISIMARLIQIPKFTGVIPLTLKPLTQQVVVGEKVLGEGQHFISWNVDMQSDPSWKPGDVRIVFKEKDVELNPRAAKALEEATHIIVAPGHTVGTILPTLATPGLKQAIEKSAAKLTIVVTLLTTPKQTTGWSGEDFVRVYESYVGRKADVVVANTAMPDIGLVAGQDWVRFGDSEHNYELIKSEVAKVLDISQHKADTVPRPILVHDEEKMKEVFAKILF